MKTPPPFERVIERDSNARILPHVVRTCVKTPSERKPSVSHPFELVIKRYANANILPQFRSNAFPKAARTRTAIHPFERINERNTNATQSVPWNLNMFLKSCGLPWFLIPNVQYSIWSLLVCIYVIIDMISFVKTYFQACELRLGMHVRLKHP